MNKPLWESHFEAAGGVVTDETRRRVHRMAIAGMPNAGDVLVSVLMGRGLTACQAEKASRELRESFRRAMKAVSKLTKACRAIQFNHQGKRKQGKRNSYAPKWGVK